MLRKTYLIAILFSIILGGCKTAVTEIQWMDSVDEAVSLAREEDKMIMIDVFTDWCTWCKELDEKTYVHPDVIKESENFVSIKINPETDPAEKTDFISQFSVQGYPTILFVSGDGNLYGRIGGFEEGPEFAGHMAEIRENKIVIDNLKTKHESGDVESSLKLLEKYQTLGVNKDAVNIIQNLKERGELPKDPNHYLTLGYYYFEQEDYPEAIKFFEHIISDLDVSGESFYHAIYMKGYCMYLGGEEVKALELLNAQLENDENAFKEQFRELIGFLQQEK